jgi:hypothetical protein
MNDEVNPNVRHERRDVNGRVLAAIVLAIVVLGVLGHFGLHGFLDWLSGNRARHQAAAHPLAQPDTQVPPGPVLQVDVSGELQRLRAQESHNLNSYGWIDRKAGRVRIPIERAMTLIVEHSQEAKKP